MPLDAITISGLQIHLAHGLGPSAFNLIPSPPCLINISLRIHLREGIVSADEDTMLGLGVNYAAVSTEVYEILSDRDRTWRGPGEVMQEAARVALVLPAVQAVDVAVEMPKGLLHAKSVKYSTNIIANNATRLCGAVAGEEKLADGGHGNAGKGRTRMEILDLGVACVIGLLDFERLERQELQVDIALEGAGWGELGMVGHKAVADIAQRVSSYRTIESLSHSLASHLLYSIPQDAGSQDISLELTIRKPSALAFACPGITLYRSRPPVPGRAAAAGLVSLQADREQDTVAGPSRPRLADPVDANWSGAVDSKDRRIFVALGSNMGDRVSNITRAVRHLQDNGCTLVGTGRIHESEPMYVEDQDRFMNSAIEIRSHLSALELLHLLKRTEKAVGRIKTFENGPRTVDLDLIYCGDEIVSVGKKGDKEDEDGVGWLMVPHWGVAEREFVLRPLVDIAPDFIDPVLRVPLSTLLTRLPSTIPPQLAPLLPFPSPAAPLRLSTPSVPKVMLIFNATPDSFSDGSADRLSIPHALAHLRQIMSEPFPPDIIDIGGMSTRPNSTPCSLEEELSRTVPLIKAIRAEPGDLGRIPISVDTYRPEVARATVEAGASCINDVRGGREEGMPQVMAEMDVPVVLMHSRGDSTSMTSAEMQDYRQYGGVVEGVRREMVEMVDRAVRAGVKRWNIILDPGLGFAKKSPDNFVLLRHLPQLVRLGTPLHGLPILVGGSRKGFVGKVIGREIAAERGIGDAVITAWCAQSEMVDVVRVHESRAAEEAIRMAVVLKEAT